MASSYGTDADKASLRQRYLDARVRLDETTRLRLDAKIRANLESFCVFDDAELVLAYVSGGEEPDTLGVIEDLLEAGRRVAVPAFDEATGSLAFYEIASLDELAPGHRGTLEPDPAGRAALDVYGLAQTVCLVPGLVFDADGHRIGYGGGYYDRFLPYYPGEKIALARTSQISSNPLPADEGDQGVDYLVTDAAIWDCK